MSMSYYDFFLETVSRIYNGFSFEYKRKTVYLQPTIPSPYNFLKDVKKPVDPLDKYIITLPEEFKRTARTEIYRSGRGWIDRGLFESKIIKFKQEESMKLVPILSKPSVGIDSSSNVFTICCFDNYQGGIVYVEKYLNIPKSSAKNEYSWHKINFTNRRKLVDNLETLFNISCKGMLALDTNLINTSNKLTYNQLVGLIEGCFSGYENHPEQNGKFRRSLKSQFFNWCNEIPIHCDSDFQTLKPDRIVKLLVQTLSKKNGGVQEHTPYFVPLESEKSLPIQLADLIAGSINLKLRNGEKPPKPSRLLFFDNRKISSKIRKQGRRAKAYYWLRDEG